MPRKVAHQVKVISPAKRTPASREEALFTRVLDIVEAARGHAARSVNSAMVHAYWLIGREIVVAEQAGAERAGYGDEVIERLSERLTRKLGKGFGPRTLWRLRQFYQLYPSGSSVAAPPILTGARTESAAPAILTGPLSQSGPGSFHHRRAPLAWGIWTQGLSRSCLRSLSPWMPAP